ncbi:MAG: RNA-protein complex protein Nop10 [Candidatus Nezhaarchaeota archaeon]|nr:RNA-protein complex protein Nop10 [Candidatus Nezhaarchaeota archaeon]MCX8141888.1 RNA-protein complex protein Nop10 [Candidatus Nezhaarchaeota archaeon]MDW8050331.1 RNA-protein complex protein Nop10 [Nitrososphaerota archaeon]
MKSLLMKCTNCGKYTLHTDKCPYCGGNLKNPHPPRYSPYDKYALYRLKVRLEGLRG